VGVREATLTWQAPTRNVDGSTLTNLAGFKVYYGTSSQSLSQSVTIANPLTTQHVVTLQPGTWYFAVSAYDATGAESARSNQVSKIVN
jgi:hypothetical protein